MDRARPWSGPDLPGHARSMVADPRGPGGTAASRLHPEHAGKARSYPLHGNVRCGRNKRRDRINVTLPFLTGNSFPGVPPSRKRKRDPILLPGRSCIAGPGAWRVIRSGPRSPVPGKKTECDRTDHDKTVRYGFPVQGKDHHADDRYHDKYPQYPHKTTGKNSGHRDAGNN